MPKTDAFSPYNKKMEVQLQPNFVGHAVAIKLEDMQLRA
jgi:hypothetical protein